VSGVANLGGGFLGGRRTAHGISFNGVQCLSRSLLFVVVVMVSVDDGVGAVLRERGRPWWMSSAEGHSSYS
jgi:hypothetical protein